MQIPGDLSEPGVLIQGFYNTFVKDASPFGYGRTKVREIDPLTQKATATGSTAKGAITMADIERHMYNGDFVGYIPVNADGLTNHGIIDWDECYKDVTKRDKLLVKVTENQFPLVATLTKSGGLHLHLFTKELVSAPQMRKTLAGVVAVLGLQSKTEIFPKNDISAPEAVGNYINAPFGEVQPDGTCKRPGVLPDGSTETVQATLARIEATAITTEVFDAMFNKLSTVAEEQKPRVTAKRKSTVSADDIGDGVLGDRVIPIIPEGNPFVADGPPCLAAIWSTPERLSDGERNNGCLAVAIYAHKKFGTDWQDEFFELADQMTLGNQLHHKEKRKIADSVESKKGSYRYSCKNAPINAFCDSTTCRTRQFGVSNATQNGGHARVLTHLRIFGGNPTAMYGVVVDGNGKTKAYRMNDGELTAQVMLNRWYVRNCYAPLGKMTAKDFEEYYKGLLANAEHVVQEDLPAESDYDEQMFQQALELVGRTAKAGEISEVADGLVFVEKTPDGVKATFRLDKLVSYMRTYGIQFKSAKDVAISLTTTRSARTVEVPVPGGLPVEACEITVPEALCKEGTDGD